MLKLSDITAIVNSIHKEGGVTAGYNATRIANDAGFFLYAMHAWRFREGASVVVPLVKDQSYVELPMDVGEITAWAMEQRNTPLEWTTPERLNLLRAGDARMAHNGYAMVVSQPPQSVQTSALPSWQLELHPKPTVDDLSIKLWYRREWPVLSDHDHVAALRSYVEPLYIQIVRALTTDGWTGTQDTASVRLSEIEQGAIYAAAKRADARVQPNQGQPQNSAVQTSRSSRLAEFSGGVTYNP